MASAKKGCNTSVGSMGGRLSSVKTCHSVPWNHHQEADVSDSICEGHESCGTKFGGD